MRDGLAFYTAIHNSLALLSRPEDMNELVFRLKTVRVDHIFVKEIIWRVGAVHLHYCELNALSGYPKALISYNDKTQNSSLSIESEISEWFALRGSRISHESLIPPGNTHNGP